MSDPAVPSIEEPRRVDDVPIELSIETDTDILAARGHELRQPGCPGEGG